MRGCLRHKTGVPIGGAPQQCLERPSPPGREGFDSQGAFQQIMLDGRHRLRADEPAAAGGDDAGPGPYELLLMALGSCTSMTLQMYAARKKWPLVQAVVHLTQQRVHARDCADCD